MGSRRALSVKSFNAAIFRCLKDYLTVVDCNGRIAREESEGAIEENNAADLSASTSTQNRGCERANAV